MQIYFHSCLCSYLSRVPILVEGTVYIYIYIYIYIYMPSQCTKVIISNFFHSVINHKLVSLDWQQCNNMNRLTSVPLLNRTDAWDSRKRPEEAVKCSNITDLFRASGADQFDL